MDYRELLKKYMGMVIYVEGSDFLCYMDNDFTVTEKEELIKISNE